MRCLAYTLGPEVESVTLWPLADVQAANEHFNEKAFIKVVKTIETEPHHYGLIIGDLFEAATRTSRANIYRSRMSPAEEARYFRQTLAPIADKLWCFVDGNHEERILRSDGINPLEDLAAALGHPERYCGEEVLIFLSVGKATRTRPGKRKNMKPLIYTIYATHGAGGGWTPGGKLNRPLQLPKTVEGVDIFVTAHGHTAFAVPDHVYTARQREKDVSKRERLHVVTGSFIDRGGYAARQMYPPGTMPGRIPRLLLSGRGKEIGVQV